MSAAEIDSVLPDHLQRRNSLVFLWNTSLTYLVAPVFYVGVLHAAILKEYEVSDTVANLAASVYLWATPLAVVIAWMWPSPRLLRLMLLLAMFAQGLAGLLVAISFIVAPASWLTGSLVFHSGVIGITAGVRTMCLWELAGRGLSPEWRGWTLGITFGFGPVFAVLGSCLSQLVLSGSFLDVITIERLAKPWPYVILFGSTAPAMWLAAALTLWVTTPPIAEPQAGPRLSEVLAGIKQYFLNRLILITTVGFVLTYGGTMIMNNLSLFAREALNESPEDNAGIQLALRFGCKCIAGFALGWVVTRIHAKASLLLTTFVCLLGVAWAIVVPGKGYLFSFGLLGAGELFFVYYMNYIVNCSPPERMRENSAYTNVVTLSVGFFPLIFGWTSDAYGYRASFVLAIGIFAATLVLIAAGLPRQPQPPTATDSTAAS